MAKKKEKAVVETVEQPKVDDKVEKIKIKKKPTMKKLSQDDEVVKVDLSKPIEETKVEEVVLEETSIEEVVEETSAEKVEEETPVIEEITDEEVKEKVEEITEQVEEAVAEAEATGKPIPENIQKLMEFMEETGGDLEDYVKLNQDYSELDNNAILKEYYNQTKPHLDSEEIDFLMEDYFSFDEDIDEERDVKRKKLALKEQVAQAKQHLDGAKSKYYEDIKGGSKLTSEQQKAVNFFNRYNAESKEQEKTSGRLQEAFTSKTNKLFNKEFKGFEYKIGEKKFRFNVKNADTVKDTQSDVNNFVGKFLNKNNEMSDAKGYHKALYTAMNPDSIANHFYEQGKADALKNSVAKSKNINMDPRQQHSGVVESGCIKVKVLGDNSNDFKFKIKQK